MAKYKMEPYPHGIINHYPVNYWTVSTVICEGHCAGRCRHFNTVIWVLDLNWRSSSVVCSLSLSLWKQKWRFPQFRENRCPFFPSSLVPPYIAQMIICHNVFSRFAVEPAPEIPSRPSLMIKASHWSGTLLRRMEKYSCCRVYSENKCYNHGNI